jgi:hypothetical protein
MVYIKGKFEFNLMRRSFKRFMSTGLALALGAGLSALEANASPSLRDCQSDHFRIYFDIRNNVLAINETAELVDCPVSNVISVQFHDHPHPITLTKVSDRWVSNPYPIYKGGCYAVEKVYVNPTHGLTPSGQYDQRIVIKSDPDSGYPNIHFCGEDNSHKTVLHPHPVAPPPPVVTPPAPRQQESLPEPSQVSLDAESKLLLKSLLDRLRQFQDILARFRDFLNTLPLG